MPHKLISIGVGRRWPAGTYDNERDHVAFDTWVLNRNQFHIPHFGTNHGICNENKFPGNFTKRRRRRFWGTSFWSTRILIKILSSALHFFAKILAIKKHFTIRFVINLLPSSISVPWREILKIKQKCKSTWGRSDSSIRLYLKLLRLRLDQWLSRERNSRLCNLN